MVNYQKIHDVATELLSRQNLDSAKIDVLKMKFDDKKIIFCSIQEYAQITDKPLNSLCLNGNLPDGMTIILPEENLYLVIYNDAVNYRYRINWTIAHEIGHIYLGHTNDTAQEEIEAHAFASYLLMPDTILSEIISQNNVLQIRDISSLFFVSLEAAQKKWNSYFYKKSIVLNQYDMIVNDKLKSYVTDYCIKKRRKNMVNPLPYVKEDDDVFVNMEYKFLYGE